MIIATRYTIEQVEGADVFKIRSHDVPLCPSCGSLCSGYDSRARRVVGDDGRPICYQLRRVRCPSCNVLHIELPNSMRPRKRYAAEVIDAVMEGGGDSCPADDRTMRRWRRENHPPEMSSLSDESMVESKHINKKGDKLWGGKRK